MQSDPSGGVTSGCDWGLAGNRQLSFSLLVNCLGDGQKAEALSQAFDEKVIAKLPRDSWTLTDVDIAGAVASLTQAQGETHVEDDAAHLGFGDMPIRTADVAPPLPRPPAP
jgi:hypothetical protein